MGRPIARTFKHTSSTYCAPCTNAGKGPSLALLVFCTLGDGYADFSKCVFNTCVWILSCLRNIVILLDAKDLVNANFPTAAQVAANVQGQQGYQYGEMISTPATSFRGEAATNSSEEEVASMAVAGRIEETEDNAFILG